MPSRITTSFLPRLLDTRLVERSQTTAVVIDILRASTTMVTALANGAQAIWPCLEIDEAIQVRDRLANALLGGERGGAPIDGFDCSNSPEDYPRTRVEGRPVVFTTTNGTRALGQVKDCQRVLVGAFVNFSALCRVLTQSEQILLLCAGTNGVITREDVLFAGAVVERLTQADGELVMDDESRIAQAAWQIIAGQPGAVADNLAVALRQTEGGRNLLRLGYESDLKRVAGIDRFEIVPQWLGDRGTVEVP